MGSKRNIFIFIIAVFLFIYVFIRAYTMSITRDESYTYLEFVQPGHWLPAVYNDVSANDHLLNTWMMMFFNKISGSSELSLRMPNVLALLMYLFFAFKFTKEISNDVLAVAGFILLTVNPYLLDFFSVARGYGISMALTMGNLYFFYRWLLDRTDFRPAIYSVLLASLAVLANFTLINVFLLILTSEGFLILFSKDHQKIKKLFVLALFPIALFSFIVPILLHLKAAGSFNLQHFGDPKGIWGDTFYTLIDKIYYLDPPFTYSIELAGILSLSLLITGIILVRKDRSLLFLRFLLFSIAFLIALIYALHYLTGAQFPMDRTGLFFIPFFSLLLIFLLDHAGKQSRIAISASQVLSLSAILLFGRSFNLLYAIEYKDDAFIKKDAMIIRERSGNKEISIGVHYSFYSTFNYYRSIWKMDQWIPTEHDALWDTEHDYYFVYPSDFKEMRIDSVVTIDKHELTNTFLLKNERKNRKQMILFSGTDDAETSDKGIVSDLHAKSGKKYFRTDGNSQFTPAIEILLNDTMLKGDNVILQFSSAIFTKEHEANAHLVISVERKDSIYSWEDYNMYFVIPENKWTTFSFNCILPQSAKAGDKVKAYVWNQGTIEVDADDLVLEGITYPF